MFKTRYLIHAIDLILFFFLCAHKLALKFHILFREEAEKYMTEIETTECAKQDNGKKSPTRKRRVRPIPITSKIPLYDKLMAEKEERSTK